MSEDDIYLTCPYEESHRIKKTRMAKHLTRCERSHSNIKLEKCPFNTLHRINPLEFEHHLSVCEYRGNAVDMFFNTEAPRQLDIVTIEEVRSIENNVPVTENWDADPEPVQSYNPIEHIEKNKILYSTLLASKAEKKKFKQKERERHAAFNNDTDMSTSQQRPQTTKLKDEIEKPLRLPRYPPEALSQNEMKSDTNGIATENKIEKVDKENILKDSTNKKLNGELMKESKYMDEDLITFTKNCIETDNDSTIQNDDLEETLNSTAETCKNMAINFPRGLQRDNGKRCSAGRGVSRVFEAYKKSGLSEEDFKSYFMNPENDIDSLVKKSAESHDYSGAFLGYTEESTLDMKDLEDELSSIGGFETN